MGCNRQSVQLMPNKAHLAPMTQMCKTDDIEAHARLGSSSPQELPGQIRPGSSNGARSSARTNIRSWVRKTRKPSVRSSGCGIMNANLTTKLMVKLIQVDAT
jgi:hypothetical protein